jgi:hypothetical protein
MNRLTPILSLLVLGLAVAFVGCDSSDSERFDENLVGTWNTENANVIVSGISIPVYEAGDEGTLAITFRSDDTFTFVAAGPIEGSSPIPGVPQVEILAEGDGATILGAYSFAAGSESVTFTPTEVDGEPVTVVPPTPVPLTFESENEVVLEVENTAEGRALLGFLLGDQVPQEIIDSIDGGSITFRRDS